MSEPLSNEGSTNTGDVDDIIDLFKGGSEDEVKPKAAKADKPEPKEGEEGEEHPDDELEFIDEEEKPKADEEKIDLKDDDIKVAAPPRKKEVEKDFPGFFAKFPWFEKMMYRDREMNEMFGSFDGAKEAAEKASTLDELEGYVSNGSTVEFFQRVKDSDNGGFNKLVKNLLPNLEKVDKDAYMYVTTDLLKRIILQAHSQGKNADNQDLQDAAATLAGWAFPNGMTAPDSDESPKDDKLEQERQEFNNERLNAAVADVRGRIGNVLKATVEAYIDPKQQMTPFVKKQAIQTVMATIDRELSNDTAFRRQVNKLWDDAGKARYNKAAVDKVKSAYLGKSKGLLRNAILSVRREALKDAPPPRRKEGGNEEEERQTRRGLISTGRSTSQNSGKKDGRKPGESIADYFARD